MLTKLFLRFVSRNVQSIVNFVHKLDAEFDAFLARHEIDLAGLKTDITNIETEAKKRIESIEDTIAEKVRAAETVLGLKNALPTNKS